MLKEDLAIWISQWSKMDQAMWIMQKTYCEKGLDYISFQLNILQCIIHHILPAQQQGNIFFFSFAREEFTVLMLETLTDK